MIFKIKALLINEVFFKKDRRANKMKYDYGLDQETEEIKLSKINSAGLINIRLSRLWDQVNACAVRGDYGKWNAYLDRIWLELSGDSDKEDEDAFIRFSLLIPKDKGDIKRGFAKVSDETRLHLTSQYVALMKKEMFLRKLMNKQGKGTAYIDEADDWE